MKQLIWIILIAFLSIPFITKGENRRHFIVLHDNSGSFYNPKFKNSVNIVHDNLIHLFNNKLVNKDYNNLSIEKENQIPFFDPQTDDISYYWFVAGQKDNLAFISNPDSDYNTFLNYFIQPGTNDSFQQARTSDNTLTIDRYLKQNLTRRPQTVTARPLYVNGVSSYSFTSFAYPCVFDVIQADYAKEYIIIVVSDFLAGSTFGNKQDEKLLRDLFKNKSHDILDRINHLSNKFYKIAYFDYFTISKKGTLLGINAFKVRANTGIQEPENTFLKFNSDITLKQTHYNKNEFEIDPITIYFGHNADLSIDDIHVEIQHDSTIWGRASYDLSDIRIDPTDMTYRLNLLPIKIPAIHKKNNIPANGINVKYILNTTYQLDNGKTLKISYELSRSVMPENFIFITQLSITQKFMILFFVLLLIAILLTLIFINRGKPRKLILKIIPFSDSYEVTDYKNGTGRLNTPYCAWPEPENDQPNNPITITIKGLLKYNKENCLWNWKENTGYLVKIRPLRFVTPPGFSAYFEHNGITTSSTEYTLNIDQTFGYDKKNKKNIPFSFKYVLKKDINTPCDKPVLVDFEVEAEVEAERFGAKPLLLHQKLTYSFHTGPDLGSVWVGIDPGTTGSCIATATNANNITIEKDSDNKDRITPSEISIELSKITSTREVYKQIKNTYLFGDKSSAYKENEDRKKFISLKKILGYKKDDEIELKKINDTPVTINSTELSTLLLSGLLDEHKKFIETDPISNEPFLDKNKKFNPKRIAVAIPNNFTATKIQHLTECFNALTDYHFEEIRFIYESEAILIHYLNTHPIDLNELNTPEGKVIFIFDMGGATINATLVRVSTKKIEGNLKYDISILGKLGYNIGGDTIDYAFLKWLYRFKKDYPALEKVDPFGNSDSALKLRKELKSAILRVKKEIITNSKQKNAQMIFDRAKLSGKNFADIDVKAITSEDGTIEKDPIYVELQKKNTNNILNSEEFTKYIWNNISSIVNDMISLCQKANIHQLDTLILSGRSSLFPNVENTVVREIQKTFRIEEKQIFLYDEITSKSAVALGACYYGTQKSTINLKNITTNCIIGVKQRTSMNNEDNKFYKLIDMGEEYITRKGDNIGYLHRQIPVHTQPEFGFDGNVVNFYQIMALDTNVINLPSEKHKYSLIANIKLYTSAQSISARVSEKDKVECEVEDASLGVLQSEKTISDADISECNDEHYTFFIK